MKKWIILILITLLMFQIVYALKDCEGVMVKGDLPCILFGSWIPENSCDTYEAKVFNEVPTLLDTRTLGNYSIIGLCNTTFGTNSNETGLGSYYINFTYGDTMRVIIEEDDDMILGIVLGVGIISALLLFFAFKLDDEHIVLKILFMISSITLLILIPVSTFITTASNAGKIFYRTFLYIFIAFWLYVFLYFCYWILKRLGWIVAGEENES